METWENDRWDKLTDNVKRIAAVGLDFRHFYKIDKADTIFIYNKGGYIGVSVTMEFGYSLALKKPIYALEKDPELARDVLYEDYAASPEELAEKLK